MLRSTRDLVRLATRDGGNSSGGRGRHPLRLGLVPGWTVAGPARAVPGGPDPGPRTRSNPARVPLSGPASRAGPRMRTRSAHRASVTARAGICRTSLPRAGRSSNGTAASAGAAPPRRPRKKEPAHAGRAAVRHTGTDSAEDLHPEGAPGGRREARRAGPPTANALPQRRWDISMPSANCFPAR
jgi:hypothetical protein